MIKSANKASLEALRKHMENPAWQYPTSPTPGWDIWGKDVNSGWVSPDASFKRTTAPVLSRPDVIQPAKPSAQWPTLEDLPRKGIESSVHTYRDAERALKSRVMKALKPGIEVAGHAYRDVKRALKPDVERVLDPVIDSLGRPYLDIKRALKPGVDRVLDTVIEGLWRDIRNSEKPTTGR